ncbi:HEPN domain-containing protein [Candidatus Woesearchaeota archaeon]|nr:HEPN domain-containing protein [Candidatus Woesearchaeota archaeon]
MNVKDCIEKGLLKKETPDRRKSSKSIDVSLYKLERAEKLLSLEMYEETVLNSYASIFHAARAILFKDGMREKSHFALFIYLKEKYADNLEKRFLNELNTLRLERHDISYGLEKQDITKEEAKHILSVAKEFISAIQKLLK